MSDILKHGIKEEILFYGRPYTLYFSFNRVLNSIFVMSNPVFLEEDKIKISFNNLFNYKSDSENRKKIDELSFDLKKMFIAYVFDMYVKEQDEKTYIVSPANPIFDIEQDIKLVYVSFVEAYNIDLSKENDKLSWRKFQTLLKELPPECALNRIIKQYRQAKPPRVEDFKNYDDYANARNNIKRYAIKSPAYDKEKIKYIQSVVQKRRL